MGVALKIRALTAEVNSRNDLLWPTHWPWQRTVPNALASLLEASETAMSGELYTSTLCAKDADQVAWIRRIRGTSTSLHVVIGCSSNAVKGSKERRCRIDATENGGNRTDFTLTQAFVPDACPALFVISVRSTFVTNILCAAEKARVALAFLPSMVPSSSMMVRASAMIWQGWL